MRFVSLFVLLLLFMIGCKSLTLTSETDLTQVIQKKLGPAYELTLSFDEKHTLAWTNKKKSNRNLLVYGVWENMTNAQKVAGTATDGKVIWLDNSTIIVDEYAKDTNTHDYNRYKIDIQTKVKSPVTNQ